MADHRCGKDGGVCNCIECRNSGTLRIYNRNIQCDISFYHSLDDLYREIRSMTSNLTTIILIICLINTSLFRHMHLIVSMIIAKLLYNLHISNVDSNENVVTTEAAYITTVESTFEGKLSLPLLSSTIELYEKRNSEEQSILFLVKYISKRHVYKCLI